MNILLNFKFLGFAVDMVLPQPEDFMKTASNF